MEINTRRHSCITLANVECVCFIPDESLWFRPRSGLSFLTLDENALFARHAQQHKRRTSNAIADAVRPTIAVVGMPPLSSFLATEFFVGGTVVFLGDVSDEGSCFVSGIGEEGSPREGDGVVFTASGGAGVAAAPGGP
jgi:hypothetical protein